MNKAFTFIELVVVIIILTIIIMVSVPAYSNMKKRMEYRSESGVVELVRAAASYYLLKYESFSGLPTGAGAWDYLNIDPPSKSVLTYDIVTGPKLEIRNQGGTWLYRYHLETEVVEQNTAHADYSYLPGNLP